MDLSEYRGYQVEVSEQFSLWMSPLRHYDGFPEMPTPRYAEARGMTLRQTSDGEVPCSLYDHIPAAERVT
jgi:hypothetical protein